MTFPLRLRWLCLTLLVVLLDRATKAWIESRPLKFFPHVVVRNYFNIIYSRNPGIAFSFFARFGQLATRIVLIVGSLLIIALIAWLLVAGKDAAAANAMGLALLLGGATGTHGSHPARRSHRFPGSLAALRAAADLNPWPTFNVADSAITIGAVLLIYDVLFPTPAAAPKKFRSRFLG